MPQKDQESIRLLPELWAQVDDLDGCLGNGKSEVIAFILRSWFSKNQAEIRNTKARIDQLMKRKKPKSAATDA